MSGDKPVIKDENFLLRVRGEAVLKEFFLGESSSKPNNRLSKSGPTMGSEGPFT